MSSRCLGCMLRLCSTCCAFSSVGPALRTILFYYATSWHVRSGVEAHRDGPRSGPSVLDDRLIVLVVRIDQRKDVYR